MRPLPRPQHQGAEDLPPELRATWRQPAGAAGRPTCVAAEGRLLAPEASAQHCELVVRQPHTGGLLNSRGPDAWGRCSGIEPPIVPRGCGAVTAACNAAAAAAQEAADTAAACAAEAGAPWQRSSRERRHRGGRPRREGTASAAGLRKPHGGPRAGLCGTGTAGVRRAAKSAGGAVPGGGIGVGISGAEPGQPTSIVVDVALPLTSLAAAA